MRTYTIHYTTVNNRKRTFKTVAKSDYHATNLALHHVSGLQQGDIYKISKSKGLRLKKSSHVVVVGKRWFDKTYGNTYHSSELWIDNTMVRREPFTYGYGSQFEQTAFKALVDIYEIPADVKRWYELKESKLIKSFKSFVSDVQRKKDL